ncbi:glycogenin-1 isoform X2 [Phymastichus coffea]|uniref:glycogenin-1 isoform X2 n=1 Tax=Phymastichus coffea TaxID=108790 RepID=UPI00273BBB57|nr:glycogenin-1 isoform X2 [Phymastichus coffea]
MSGFAWVTLATNDTYALGALVLAHSLRRVNTQYDLIVLVTPGVTQFMKVKLSAVFTLTREVNILDSKDEANLNVLQRPELGITFTKLHCWKLTDYEKCVFLDADTLVINNSDDLFIYEEFSAAPDVGWPDCFNSGVFVFKPSEKTFNDLIKFASVQRSFDGADQGLLNMYFDDWAHKDISKHLPFIYNTCTTATYSYFSAFLQYWRDIKIIHFIGTTKPWLLRVDSIHGNIEIPDGFDHLQQFLQLWWSIFHENVQPELTQVITGLAGTLSKLNITGCLMNQQIAIEDQMRKQNWEQGEIDFMGQDSFDNILKKINDTLYSVSQKQYYPRKETEEQ